MGGEVIILSGTISSQPSNAQRYLWEAQRPFFRGTIIRIPFRDASSPPSSICDCITEEEDFASFLSELEGSLPKSLLFTYNLQSINLNVWHPTDTKTKSINTDKTKVKNLLEEEKSKVTKLENDLKDVQKLLKNSEARCEVLISKVETLTIAKTKIVAETIRMTTLALSV